MTELDDVGDRILQLENLVFDLPNLLNSRLDGVEGHIRASRMAYEETGTRLARIEKVQGMLQADVRDLRNGVTLQLRLQNEQTKSLETEVKKQGQRLEAIEMRLDSVENRLDGVEKRLDGVEKRLDGVEKRLDGVERRLESVEGEVASMSRLLKAIAQKLGVAD